MASFNKIYAFIEEVFQGAHNFSGNTFKCALTNTAPTTGSTVWSTGSFPAPDNVNGYTAGGNTLNITGHAQSSGTLKVIVDDTVFTATAGGIGPFRYAIIYNSSSSDKIVGWYDYLSSISIADTETFTVDFDPTNGMIQAT